MKKELGVITRAYLGIGEFGFTFSLEFSFGRKVQCFGFYGLDYYDEEKKKKVGSAFGCECIMRILTAVGVDSWDKLKGKEMWVYRKDSGGIQAIEAPAYRKDGGKFDIEETAKEYEWEQEEAKKRQKGEEE